MKKHLPYSIKVFMPGGDPNGLRVIEKSNWSGIGLVFPRPLYSEAKQRRDLSRTGVYVLVGPVEDSGLPRIYVGEGDPIRPRLDQHGAKKDFWTTCMCFTSKDENLNKAHVQYLESRLVSLAVQSKRCLLDNGNAPQLPSLSESDCADAEGFLAEMLLCLPLIGISVFSIDDSTMTSQQGGVLLTLSSRGLQASGRETSEGFVVLSGSQSAKAEVPSCHEFIKQARQTLVSNGVLQAQGAGYVFAQNYVFASPSTAAGVVLGRSANGRIEWKTKGGTTLKELQLASTTDA